MEKAFTINQELWNSLDQDLDFEVRIAYFYFARAIGIIDLLGEGYAKQNPDLIASFMEACVRIADNDPSHD